MANIFEIFDHMRDRPGMYFGKSLAQIEIFCRGYYTGLAVHQVRELAPTVDTFHFGAWLYRRFNWPYNCGWASAIRRNFQTDDEAFIRFFELIDEYRRLRRMVCAEITLGRSHKPTVQSPVLGSGAWYLPPVRLEICRYMPEDFFFLVEYHPDRVEDRLTLTSLEAAASYAEKCWQIKPQEWHRYDSEAYVARAMP